MIIKIEKEGTVKFIYKDSHPALKLGKPDIRRFSDVRYDNTLGLWFVYKFNPMSFTPPKNYVSILECDNKEKLIEQGFTSREEAIKNEIDFIEKQLINSKI